MMIPKYVVGDPVTLVNDQGVSFPGRIVVGVEVPGADDPRPYPRYYLHPSDTPWYAFAERNLYPAPRGPARDEATRIAEEWFEEHRDCWRRREFVGQRRGASVILTLQHLASGEIASRVVPAAVARELVWFVPELPGDPVPP